MGQTNDIITLRAAAAMSAGRRVTINASGQAALAGNTVKGIGILQRDVTAESWDSAAIRTWGVGTYEVSVTGAPVTAGDLVYAAANGQVAATGTITIGQATQSRSVNGTFVEVANIA